MWVFPLAFLVLIVVLVFRGASICGSHTMRHAQESAREALDRRYARGEIGREEYQRIKADLDS